MAFLLMDLVDSFPGYTQWEESNCCFFSCSYIPSLKTKYWHHWEIEPVMPSIIIFFISLSYILFSTVIINNFKDEKAIMLSIETFFFIFFLYCYYRIIRDGPGYLPFYYPITNEIEDKDNHLMDHYDENSLSGLISMQRQLDWTMDFPKQPRLVFLQETRRFVIRPDHECFWVSSWIGKRNHKFFMLFNLYGFIYLLIYTVYDVRMAFGVIGLKIPTLKVFFFLVLGILGVTFSLLTLVFLAITLNDARKNSTAYEQMKLLRTDYDNGIIKNFEEICGSIGKWYLWILPISPFSSIPSNDLAAQYMNNEL